MQRLHLENLPSLKATKQQKLPQLQRLTITECGNLQQIDLVVNGLRNLTLEKLAALRQVQIAAEKLQKSV
ncbi:MAG: hypothetical protein HWD59_03745 [Coxiellaceae bacterium]|nr:MAG: hypothetical protein HWD59_03745 [Coxiellaceae bacterium]